MYLNQVRRGAGPRLLLLHDLGGSWKSWRPVINILATERRVIAVDLPGFGKTPPLPGELSIAALAEAVASFLGDHEMLGIDLAGVGLGGQLALELARRAVVGSTIAFAPTGFAQGSEMRRPLLALKLARRTARAAQPMLPTLASSAVARTALLSPLTPQPWTLPAGLVLEELNSYAVAPSFDSAVEMLAGVPEQLGSERGRIVIGWGDADRICVPAQARRAMARFPRARLQWLARCGHLPHWEVPQQVAQLILDQTGDAFSQSPHAERSWLEHVS